MDRKMREWGVKAIEPHILEAHGITVKYLGHAYYVDTTPGKRGGVVTMHRKDPWVGVVAPVIGARPGLGEGFYSPTWNLLLDLRGLNTYVNLSCLVCSRWDVEQTPELDTLMDVLHWPYEYFPERYALARLEKDPLLSAHKEAVIRYWNSLPLDEREAEWENYASGDIPEMAGWYIRDLELCPDKEDRALGVDPFNWK